MRKTRDLLWGVTVPKTSRACNADFCRSAVVVSFPGTWGKNRDYIIAPSATWTSNCCLGLHTLILLIHIVFSGRWKFPLFLWLFAVF